MCQAGTENVEPGVMTQTSFKVLDTAVRSLDLILKVKVRA